MTKKWRKVILKAQRDVLARIICDRCGADILLPRRLTAGETEVREFELSFYEGSAWPEEGLNVMGWAVHDLCDKCLAVLHEWLVANGFNVQEYDPGYDPRDYLEDEP